MYISQESMLLFGLRFTSIIIIVCLAVDEAHFGES